MMRRLVRIWSKFRRHNLDVLRCNISVMQSGNCRVMVPKFCPDPNQASRHKHTLSVTLGLEQTESAVGPRRGRGFESAEVTSVRGTS
jgi:hypothetical protein